MHVLSIVTPAGHELHTSEHGTVELAKDAAREWWAANGIPGRVVRITITSQDGSTLASWDREG